MAWSLIHMFSESFIDGFGYMTSGKEAYSLGSLNGTLSPLKWAIWTYFKGYMSLPKSIFRAAIGTMKVSYFGSGAVARNSFCFISSTYLIVRSTSLVVWEFYYKSRAWKFMLALLMVGKTISNTRSALTLTNRKLSSKNLFLPSLSDTEKVEITIT